MATPADRSKVNRIITTFLDANEVQDAIASQWEAMVNSSGITGNELEENPQAVLNALRFQQKIFSNQGKVASMFSFIFKKKKKFLFVLHKFLLICSWNRTITFSWQPWRFKRNT